MDNIVNLVSDKNISDLEAAIIELKENTDGLIKYYAITASLKRAYYESLIESGFSEEQALELCKLPAVI